MTINALVAADEIIIPVQPAYLPVVGLQMLIKTISVVKKRLNKKLSLSGQGALLYQRAKKSFVTMA